MLFNYLDHELNSIHKANKIQLLITMTNYRTEWVILCCYHDIPDVFNFLCKEEKVDGPTESLA